MKPAFYAVLDSEGHWTGRIVSLWGLPKDTEKRLGFRKLGRFNSLKEAREAAEKQFGRKAQS